ncbi:MAG: serine hydrolase domain-containing protein [Opitutus sp.]
MKLRHLFSRSTVLLSGLLAFSASEPEARADDRFAPVPAKVKPFVEQGEISGAVMLVGDKDRILHLSAVGESDLKSHREMRTDDLFWIASMSKPITAVAIALLVDDGKLTFDDPVERHLPEFAGQWVTEESSATRRILVKATRPITLRDLLTHTSGVGEYAVTDPHWTLAEMSKVLAREPLRFQPGTRWGYSTAGTDVLGRVVEKVSGQPFEVFLRQRLFEPLGMKDTGFYPSPEQEQRRARDYRPSREPGKLEEITVGYLYGAAVMDPARPPLGGAGLFSTAADIFQFYRMMLNGGTFDSHRILKSETVTEMTRKQTRDLTARPGMPWGLGFCVIEDPSKMEANATLSPGTFGHGGAHGTNSWADPQRGLITLFMIQRDLLKPNPDDSPMRRAYQRAVADALAGR